MARTFTRAGFDYLEYVGALLTTAAPITFACWYKPTGVDNCTLIGYKNTGISDEFLLEWQVSNSRVSGQAVVGASPGTANSPATAIINTQNCGCIVFASSTSRTCYNNGVAGTEDTTSRVPNLSSANFDIGRLGAATSSANSDISEIAVWNVALTASEVAWLSTSHGSYVGYSAKLVRPSSLIHYWRISGSASPEIDEISGYNLTVSGTTSATHPLIDYGPLSLYERIDEAVVDDNDFDRSGASPSNDTMEVQLTPLSTPVAGDVTFTVRARLE